MNENAAVIPQGVVKVHGPQVELSLRHNGERWDLLGNNGVKVTVVGLTKETQGVEDAIHDTDQDPGTLTDLVVMGVGVQGWAKGAGARGIGDNQVNILVKRGEA